jgi:hypothetical protein
VPYFGLFWPAFFKSSFKSSFLQIFFFILAYFGLLFLKAVVEWHSEQEPEPLLNPFPTDSTT